MPTMISITATAGRNRGNKNTALRQAQGPSLLVDGAADGEVELAVVVTCSPKHIVEAITPVKAQQAKHRQIDADTDTSRTFHIEGIEALEPEPTIACLKESQSIDGRLWI